MRAVVEGNGDGGGEGGSGGELGGKANERGGCDDGERAGGERE